ncbi:hypothetical protein B0H14DRAFT_3544120 [Mycena olivaceomarginata]|nr:hypothetical protein B0H14DRAFT_3544120 [Mycena olivaceomarginata]
MEVANARQVHTPAPNAPSQMTHLHSLTAVALALLLASSCCAELVNVRPPPPHKCTASGPAKQPDPLADAEVLNIVLLASVDGRLHALDRATGETRWSMAAPGPSSAQCTTLAPLVRTAPTADPDLDNDDEEQHNTPYYIVEPQSGDIYVLAPPRRHSRSAPLQRFPYSVPELVDMSPFSFAEADDHRVFVGRKATSEVVVELETGEVRFGGADTCPWGPFPDLNARDGPGRREVVVGRTDYHVTIHARLSGKRKLVPAQTLAFSTYGPSSRDNILQRSYRSTEDGVYMESLPNGELVAFKTGSKADPGVLWGREFKSPIVAIFDPRPLLYTILHDLVHTTPMDRLPHLGSVYIGLVEETGSLFAMSLDRFPLVAFAGGPKRRENAMKPRNYGSGDDRCLDRSSLYTDRRCLVGMRPLAGGDGDSPEYRLKRLVDGVPGVVRGDHR